MSFVRSSPGLRAVARNTLSPRLTARSFSRSRLLRADVTKGNTTGPKDGSSDMPWIIGAVAFTVPASYYLLSASSPKPQHSDPHAPTSPGDNVQTEHEEKHDSLTSPNADTSGGDQATEKDESEGSDAVEATAHGTEQAEDTVGETQGKDQETATELQQETGGAAGETGDKITGDSSAAGHGPETNGTRNPAERDAADAKHDPNTTNEMSGKQEGVSNADTAHATSGGGAISKKGEGMHDTSKLKGTVDVNRPSK